MKKPKPQPKTFTVETREELDKIKTMYPQSDFIRCLTWVELRLPDKASITINNKEYHRFRLEMK
jgi:hypothetical protein